jgi:hypothetical protein
MGGVVCTCRNSDQEAVESGIRCNNDWIQACRKAVTDLRNGKILNQKGVEYVTGMLS